MKWETGSRNHPTSNQQSKVVVLDGSKRIGESVGAWPTALARRGHSK